MHGLDGARQLATREEHLYGLWVYGDSRGVLRGHAAILPSGIAPSSARYTEATLTFFEDGGSTVA